MRAGAFQPKKRMFWGNPIGAIQYLKQRPRKNLERDFLQGHEVTEQGGMVSNWNWVGLYQILGKKYLLWGWWGTRTGYPKKWWVFHLWKCSRQRWMELWTAWSSGRVQGLELHDFYGPFQLKPLHDFMKCISSWLPRLLHKVRQS